MVLQRVNGSTELQGGRGRGVGDPGLPPAGSLLAGMTYSIWECQRPG